MRDTGAARRSPRLGWVVSGLIVAPLGLALGGGCGSGGSGSTLFPADSSVADGGHSSDASSESMRLGNGGGDGGACTSASQCHGGMCFSGVCCDTAQHVCGSSCCDTGKACVFDKCVTPGAPCQTSDQCAMGQYCEPGLGGGEDAGPPPAGCTSIAVNGRCLPIPPTCAAGTTPDGGSCLEQCEYHPNAQGMLNAKTLWQWGPVAKDNPSQTDIWSTPTVGRMYDTNCDGKIDSLDSPVIVFISGDVSGTCCGCSTAAVSTCETGVVRMVNGTSGEEIWTLAKAGASSVGFMGSTPALGDIDHDGVMDVVAMTGEGYVVLIDHLGRVTRTSDKPYPHATALSAGQGTGWGGGLAIADMDNDGFPEITFGDTIWTTTGGAITRKFVGGAGTGGGANMETSALSDMDGDGKLDLLAGNTCYSYAAGVGAVLWKTTLPEGFPGVGDFSQAKTGKSQAVLVAAGSVWVLDGATGAIVYGPFVLPGTGSGGAPTVADFDGDGHPEIGVAQQNKYTVVKVNYTTGMLEQLWTMDNHDFSSSVTGSTVFDFEGDGIPEVVYADECWLWVFDGPTGAVRLAFSHSSFTGTEAAMVADINGDGHAEMLIPSNGVDMKQWDCEAYQTMTMNGVNWTPGPMPNLWYRGLVALGDTADSWVGTRTLWTEHTYHVTNICDDTDTACGSPNVYGSIPSPETKNWTVPWLNDFRQNVQDKGIFNAPDAVVALSVACATPPVATVSIRNIGQAGLPANVVADVYLGSTTTKVGSVQTTYALLPGQTQTLTTTLSAPASSEGSFSAQIVNNPAMPTFHECNTNNDKSPVVSTNCPR